MFSKSILRHAMRVWLPGLIACAGLIVLGHFLRQLNFVLSPLAWASVEIISALLCFTIAANVLVRYHGTGNRISLWLGLTFGVIGIIDLRAIFEFYHRYLKHSEQFRVLVSWMVGQTLLGLLFLLACVMDKWLPQPRDPKKNVFPALATIASAAYLVVTIFLIFPNDPPIYPHSSVPRPWEFVPAAMFLAAAIVLNRFKDRERYAFDTVLVWAAGMNAACHVIASQSARVLDAPAGTAKLLNTTSYIVLLGAALLDNSRLFRQVRTLAISDSLTGLANYRRLVDVLQNELERSGRTSRPFSVLLMDLDGLKAINDRYGHLIGSRALCRVASVLRLNCRSIDTAARYGGDEFALVLPETNASAAQQMVTRLRNCLEADQEVPHLSLSIGVATFPQCGVTIPHLFEFADKALYAIKQSKRGTIEERKPSSLERRSATRFNLSLPIIIQDPLRSGEITGLSRNISSQGIYLTTDRELTVGSTIKLSFTLPITLPAQGSAGVEVFIRARGRVLRVDKEKGSDYVGVALVIEKHESVRV